MLWAAKQMDYFANQLRVEIWNDDAVAPQIGVPFQDGAEAEVRCAAG
mgnify:CR=1 FL=1